MENKILGFSKDINDEALLLQKFQEHADMMGFQLNERAPIVARGVIKREGHCPCRKNRVPCPCPTHLMDVKTDGQCHCGLFVALPDSATKEE